MHFHFCFDNSFIIKCIFMIVAFFLQDFNFWCNGWLRVSLFATGWPGSRRMALTTCKCWRFSRITSAPEIKSSLQESRPDDPFWKIFQDNISPRNKVIVARKSSRWPWLALTEKYFRITLAPEIKSSLQESRPNETEIYSRITSAPGVKSSLQEIRPNETEKFSRITSALK